MLLVAVGIEVAASVLRLANDLHVLEHLALHGHRRVVLNWHLLILHWHHLQLLHLCFEHVHVLLILEFVVELLLICGLLTHLLTAVLVLVLEALRLLFQIEALTFEAEASCVLEVMVGDRLDRAHGCVHGWHLHLAHVLLHSVGVEDHVPTVIELRVLHPQAGIVIGHISGIGKVIEASIHGHHIAADLLSLAIVYLLELELVPLLVLLLGAVARVQLAGLDPRLVLALILLLVRR